MELSTQTVFILILIGLMAGMLSGFVGVGGGMIIVPSLVYFLALNQLNAQGTSLAVLMMPVGILGVMNYYKMGQVNITFAIVIGLAFIAGSYIGSKFALKLPEYKVKFFFGAFMLIMSLQIIWKAGLTWWANSSQSS